VNTFVLAHHVREAVAAYDAEQDLPLRSLGRLTRGGGPTGVQAHYFTVTDDDGSVCSVVVRLCRRGLRSEEGTA